MPEGPFGTFLTSSAPKKLALLGRTPHFSLDKTSTLSSTGSQTLRTQWFGDTFAIPLDNSSTFSTNRRSDTTNTVVLEAASSKRTDVDFARRNKYF